MADPTSATPWINGLIGAGGVIVGSLITWMVQARLLGRRIEADEKLAQRKFDFDKELAEQKLKFDSGWALRKFEFDKELAQRKSEADIGLAKEKFALDASLADRKRRQDLAEEVLSGFYQMAAIIRGIRSPFSHLGEGKDRPKSPGESEEVGRLRDSYFVIIDRFEVQRKEIADLLSRRYRMAAWFGKEADGPFETIEMSLINIILSARHLVESEEDNLLGLSAEDAALRRAMRANIWEGTTDPDPIAEKIVLALSSIESICRPILQGQSA